jgi:hypothetical protein
MKRKIIKEPIPRVKHADAFDQLVGKHDDPDARRVRDFLEFQSYIKILKTLQQGQLKNILVPSMLLIQNN